MNQTLALAAAVITAATAATVPAREAHAQSEDTTVAPAVQIAAPRDAERPVRVYAPPAYNYYGSPGDSHPYGAARVFEYVGGPVPEGGHLESRPTVWPIVLGVVGMSVAYTGALGVALGTCSMGESCDNGHGWLYVPVIGPFVAAANAPTSGGGTLAAFDGAIQLLSVTSIIAGFAFQHRVVVFPAYASDRDRRRNRGPELAFVPAAQGASVGGTVSVTTF